MRKIIPMVTMLMLIAPLFVFAQPPDPAIQKTLADRTQSFLNLWVGGDFDKATGYFSAITAKNPEVLTVMEEFVDVDSTEYKSASGENLIKTTLVGIKNDLWPDGPPKGGPLLTLLEGKQADEIFKFLAKNHMQKQLSRSLKFATLRVEKWEHIGWTGSSGPELREVFKQDEMRDRPVYGVLVQVRTNQSEEPLPFVFVWVGEPPADWKLLTLLPVQTE